MKLIKFLIMVLQDNRNYKWENEEQSIRHEYKYIETWIPTNSKVIDLACGNGTLLQNLKKNKNIIEYGIEISSNGVKLCKEKGLNVQCGRIDKELKDIPDNAYDFSVCNASIQMVMYPEITLQQMKRISKYQVVSFPNFAFLLNRLELLFKGRMPGRMLFGYNWYNTGHIHQLSIKDFKKTVLSLDLKINDCVYLFKNSCLPKYLIPNLFAECAIFLLQK